MKEVSLNKGYTTLVDDEDYGRVCQYSWVVRGEGTPWVYAQRTFRVDGKMRSQLLHRFILGVTDHHVRVDHIDHNGLNCQRYNMRIATPGTNLQNGKKRRGIKRTTSSCYKGVDWQKSEGKWRCRIRKDNKQRCIGYFHDEKEAARAYDAAARELFGEFAHLNFP